jgi:hypothetical protein
MDSGWFRRGHRVSVICLAIFGNLERRLPDETFSIIRHYHDGRVRKLLTAKVAKDFAKVAKKYKATRKLLAGSQG